MKPKELISGWVDSEKNIQSKTVNYVLVSAIQSISEGTTGGSAIGLANGNTLYVMENPQDIRRMMIEDNKNDK